MQRLCTGPRRGWRIAALLLALVVTPVGLRAAWSGLSVHRYSAGAQADKWALPAPGGKGGAPPVVIRPVKAPLKALKKMIDRQKLPTKTALIDYIMSVVHDHTLFCIDQWHNEHWLDKELILSGVYRSLRGHPEQRPHSSCGPRCMVMTWLLQAYGIKARHIGVFTSKYADRLHGHQQLSVFNPD